MVVINSHNIPDRNVLMRSMRGQDLSRGDAARRQIPLLKCKSVLLHRARLKNAWNNPWHVNRRPGLHP